MKRDLDLVRRILLSIEEHHERGSFKLQYDDVAPDTVAYHVMLLKNAGLITAIDARTMESFELFPVSLTWEGHEFLDAARSKTVWEAAKAKVKAIGGGVAMAVMKALLIETAKEELGLK